MQKRQLKLGELFVGAGGLGIGFILAEHPLVQFQPVFAIDNDANALKSYHTNLHWLYQHSKTSFDIIDCRAIRRDISTLNVLALLRFSRLKPGELDILIGGPPCQGYSSSNRTRKKESKSDRNRLTRVFMDKVMEICPRTFLLENVQGVQWTAPTNDMTVPRKQPLLPLYNDNGGESVNQDNELNSVQQFVIRKAQSEGYKVWYGVIDSAEFGVPQHRNRFFLYGVRKEILPENSIVDLDVYLKNLLVPRFFNVEDAIGDLPPLENGKAHQGDYQPSDNDYVRLMRRYMDNGELHDHFATRHEDYVLERYKRIKPGENWKAIKDLMGNYSNIENTHSNIYRRLQSDEPANTITHYRKSMIIHPTQHRGLSFREACRLQSFPDWFRFVGRTEEMQQQLANAVPPLLASRVAYAIAQFWVDHIKQIDDSSSETS